MNELGKIIDEYLKKNDISLRDFANKCQLSHSYVAKLRKGVDPRSKSSIQPTIDTIEKLAKGMDMETKDLLIKAKYIKPDNNELYTIQGDKIPTLVKEIELKYITLAKEIQDNEIPPEDLQKIIEVIRKNK